MEPEYTNYLASLHAKLVTPDDVICDVIKESMRLDLATKIRIVSGEVNEVYDITLTNHDHVILRISRSGENDFVQEVWALGQVIKVGVPVPEILSISHRKLAEGILSFCVMKKIDGEPLERGKIDFNALSEVSRKAYITNAGEILSRIHSIKTKGYGWIIGDGKAEFDTSSQIIDKALMKEERLYDIAGRWDFEKSKIDAALKIVDGFRTRYSDAIPRLNHGDYGHKHFMVKDGIIVAILDWGGVRSDTPVYDFMIWDYWFGDFIPTAWLKEGYKDKELFNDGFEDMLHTLRVMKGIEVIDWYDSQNYKQMVEKLFAKLTSDLNYFAHGG
ncbi:aminoglycoside phosphotransferase family protein [Candidatus Kaiserbacteria bacterium]|nr:aminoglycoside phosphotransferase family protein [Candidatus Kaiserbacteria bacterium]